MYSRNRFEASEVVTDTELIQDSKEMLQRVESGKEVTKKGVGSIMLKLSNKKNFLKIIALSLVLNINYTSNLTVNNCRLI